ncbi:hypothetical protein BJX76DRAFT_368368 [Aspergillus varians]
MTGNHEDSEYILRDSRRGFLGQLTPAIIPHYPYRGREQFRDDFRHAVDTLGDQIEWFIVTGVDKKTFTTQFLELESSPFSRWCAYDSELELLLVRMTKHPAHETASRTFNTILYNAIEHMGMKWSLAQVGSATHRAAIGGKEADEAWKPVRTPRGQSRAWPSAVLEVAYSETKRKLQSDVRYWHRASQGDVKVILTIQINRNLPQVTIEQWEVNANNKRERTQSVVISSRGRTIRVLGGPLIIDFSKLFLREPTIPREQDIVIEGERLRFLARQVWDVQNF